MLSPRADPFYKFMKSGKIRVNAEASEVYDAIIEFYQSYYQCDIEVERAQYDRNGERTTTASEVKSTVYTITVKKLMSMPSLNNLHILPVKINDKTKISYELPGGSDGEAQESSRPLQGKYVL